MKKPFITLIIFLIIITLGIGLIWPSFEKLKTLSVELQQKEREIKDLEDYISHLQNISLQLNEFSSQLSKIEAALPYESYLPNFFQFLQNTSSATGVGLIDVKISGGGALKGKENIREREITIKVIGSYPNFKNFLSSLENSARIVEIPRISFSVKSLKTPSSFDLTIKTYFR